MLMQARVLSIARVCVIDIYSTFGGNMAVEYSAAEHMASFDIVCRWETTTICTVNEGLPDDYFVLNKSARQMAHVK